MQLATTDALMDHMRPYETLLNRASEQGLVLKRNHIYGSGPPVDDISGGARDMVSRFARGRVLDLGAGCGALQRFLPSNCEYLGIEADVRAVEMAAGLGRNVIAGDARQTGFVESTFDCCAMIEVLEHIDDYAGVLKEATRNAPRLLLTVPNIGVLPEMSSSQVVPWHLLEATHVNFFTVEALRKVLLNYYKDVEVWEINPWFQPGCFMNIAAVANL